MAGSVSDNYGAGRSVDSLTEWRSSEQLETGTPSTSPPYWDTDDDDDGGLRPSQLYGKFTWKIENFSQITKRELRSNVFEVGGYKWYILIYPQGCDVCNHLSLFLCVANHDKLLPGWSHFAQFTIAVVNRDAKKSKYSDTLHRFWKKEHDWGWKKFMELSKVLDGFIDKDSLVIKAQVQVIREKTDRPFRCLDCQYRRELVRVYLSNVEQICRRFVEERRSKLAKLIEDKVRWSSFHAFWLGMDQNTRRLMSRDKTDVILKVVVKHFFIEKEVTSTLVMDSLYSGLKALENQSKNKNVRLKMVESEEIPAPIVYVEKDTFVLADDILLLLERAALEPLPPKDDKGPQNRTKDGSSGDDVNKDLIERDERRLTELGRRTVEIFILAHIFSNRIEVAYQEAIALKRQEELIREEEAAGQAESELKAKRSEKEKRGKKKQAKQRKSNRKGKDKGRDEKLNREVQDTHQIMTPSGERILENCSVKQTLAALEKKEVLDEASDITDAGDELNEVVVPNFEEGESCALNSDTDTSEIHPGNEVGSNEIQGESTDLTNKNSSIPDDSSSTCSTDSVPSVSTNGSYNGVFSPNHKTHFSSRRGKSQHFKVISKGSNSTVNLNNQPTHTDTGGSHQTDSTTNCISSDPGSGNTAPLVNDREQLLVQRVVEKLEEAVSLHTEINPTETEENSHFKQNIRTGSSPPWSPKGTPCQNKQQIHSDLVSPSEPSLNWETPSNGLEKTPRTTVRMTKSPLIPVISNSDTPKPATSSKNVQSLPVDKSITRQLPTMSRPLSAPLVPGPRPISSAVSTSSSEPSLARSVSAAGRLGIETSSSNHGYLPQSYRNAIIGKTTGLSSNSVPLPMSSSSLSPLYNQSSNPLSSTSSFSLKTRTMDVNSTTSGYTFGLGGPDLHHSGRQWFDRSQPERRNVVSSHFDIHNSGNFRPESYNGGGLSATCKMPSGFQEDFPHLDIINDLLNEEKCSGSTSEAIFDGSRDSLYHINRQYSFPGNVNMDMDLSTNPCSLDRVYSLPFDGFRDGVSANMPSIYANGEIDGIILNQWQGSRFDGSLFNIKTMEENRYQNPLTNYLNVPCGANGFPIFRPSNGT